MPTNTFVSMEEKLIFSHQPILASKRKKIKPLKTGLRPVKPLKSGVFHINEVSRNFFFVTWFPLQMALIYFLKNLTFTVHIVLFNPCSPWLLHVPFNLRLPIQTALSTHTHNRCINSSLFRLRACKASKIGPCLIVHLVSIQLTGCFYRGNSREGKPLTHYAQNFNYYEELCFRIKGPFH